MLVEIAHKLDGLIHWLRAGIEDLETGMANHITRREAFAGAVAVVVDAALPLPVAKDENTRTSNSG
jgi:hypothetical protein